MREALPRRYGRYQLLEVLGAGGMGVVYRAETEPLAGIKRAVAIKQIQAGTGAAENELVELLLDEARIWVRLQHPNIVSVVDFGREGGDWFLALELIEGITAAEAVDADGKLPVPEALCVVERVARALAYAHTLPGEDGRKLRIIHRDVKPANILLSTRGEVKLTDFGIARATDRRTATQAGQVRGSLRVMSPEQVRGEPLDARADLFSLGCTLHELVTGKPLLAGSRNDVLTALARKQIPPPDPALSPSLRDLIARLTAPEPAKRPASAEEVARQVRAMLLPESVEDVQPALAQRVRRVGRGETAPNLPKLVSGSETVTLLGRGATGTGTTTVPSPPVGTAAPAARLVGKPARPWERFARPDARTTTGAAPESTDWAFHLRIAAMIAAALVIATAIVVWIAGR